MAVALIFKTNATREQYEQSVKEAHSGGRPEGLIFQGAGPGEDGKWHIVSIWESEDAEKRFAEERLMPVFRKHGIDPSQEPGNTRTQIHLESLIR